ncbi:MAG: hypothetical protein U0525_02700 [Patescibacteria group bacterium]
MLFYHLVVYAVSFLAIWVGAGLAIKSVEEISKSLKLSTFAVSFLVLGFFTSISEFSVGVNSVLQNDPEIFVGNLIGASIVIFLFIVPLLAITGKNLNIGQEFRGFNLLLSLIVISLPSLLAIDGSISMMDALILIIIYLFLVLSIQSKKGIFGHIKDIRKSKRQLLGKDISKIVIGIFMIFVASRFVVVETEYFAKILNVSPFLVSLLIISIGTNIPELSFVVRSLFMRNHQVAFGDYVGSAAFNTFLMGFLSIMYGKAVSLTNSYLVSLSFLSIGLTAFYFFAKSKHSISRTEAIILLLIYCAFLMLEIIIHR